MVLTAQGFGQKALSRCCIAFRRSTSFCRLNATQQKLATLPIDESLDEAYRVVRTNVISAIELGMQQRLVSIATLNVMHGRSYLIVKHK